MTQTPFSFWRPSSRTLGLSMAILTGVAWAVLAIGLKYALSFSTSGTIAWFRMFVAFFMLAGLLALQGTPQLRILLRPPLLTLAGALGLALNYFGYMKGVEYTGANNAQIFIQTGPMLLILTGILFFGERPRLIQIVGFTVALLGLFFFFQDQSQYNLHSGSTYLLGNVWLLIAAVAWTVFAAFQKQLLGRFSPQQLNLVTYLVAGLALLPNAHLSELATWTLGQWAVMFLLAANTVVAYGALAIALQHIPASQVSIIITCNPLLTISLMTLMSALSVTWVTPEDLHWRGYLGAAVVIVGVILAVRKPQAQSSQA